jgi:hypothetical protein
MKAKSLINTIKHSAKKLCLDFVLTSLAVTEKGSNLKDNILLNQDIHFFKERFINTS